MSIREDTIRQRRKRLWSLLVGENIGAVLVSNQENIRYLTGFTGSESLALVTKRNVYLVVDPRYTSQAQSECKYVRVLESARVVEGIKKEIAKRNIREIGIEPHYLTVAQYRKIKKECKVKLVESKKDIGSIRSVKDDYELGMIRKAAAIASSSFMELLYEIRPDELEWEIAASLENKIKLRGADSVAFPTIVASGKRGALPHGMPSKKGIRKGELVVIDFGSVYHGYCSDETCTLSVGKPGARQRVVYGAVKEAHDRTIEKIRPGVRASDLDNMARGVLRERGLEKYFRHSTGHGVGLAVHEEPLIAPKSDVLLEENMVFTIEPGVYIPGWGGVRIEDTVRVTGNGCEVISNVSKELHCL